MHSIFYALHVGTVLLKICIKKGIYSMILQPGKCEESSVCNDDCLQMINVVKSTWDCYGCILNSINEYRNGLLYCGEMSVVG